MGLLNRIKSMFAAKAGGPTLDELVWQIAEYQKEADDLISPSALRP